MPMFSGDESPTAIEIRGLHIDICRHFISPEMVMRIATMMARIKLNTLHLHMSDDQALPVQFEGSPAYGRDGRPAWTVDDQKRVAAHCKSLGIQVMPEIDMPGHCAAFLAQSHPESGFEPTKKLGVIVSARYMNVGDIEVAKQLLGELAGRFDSEYVHMGGDEIKEYDKRNPNYPIMQVVRDVCAHFGAQGRKVVAWDDVLTGWKGVFPSNLVIQRWRYHTSPHIHHVPVILSWGYYLDHCDDPFTVYQKAPTMWGPNIGCIACTWTELIDEANIEATIFPSLYMAAHRWWNFPRREEDLPRLLHDLVEEFGLPGQDNEQQQEWRMRRWDKFYTDDKRSCSSVDVDTPLDRDHDRYPVFSRALVDLAHELTDQSSEVATMRSSVGDFVYRLFKNVYSDKKTGDDIRKCERGWKTRVRTAISKHAKTEKANKAMFRNGATIAIRRALRTNRRNPIFDLVDSKK